jgi:hypothetical protein
MQTATNKYGAHPAMSQLLTVRLMANMSRVVFRLGEPVVVLMPQRLRNSIDEKADSYTGTVM